ncbi:MAG TPA: sigma-54 dependent transcriptional regulator [Candidatus Polarisedimenticolaceae bacterium]|nr:sigma-54 dependent transcriptional regulator [Candidatus Polarisedimenticolaceae bacterium]
MSPRGASLLVVEDDPLIADQLRWALKDQYELRLAHSRDQALAELNRARPDLVLLDLCLPPGNVPEEGFAVFQVARSGDTVVLVMSALEEREPALRAIEQGAYDFFTKPLDLTELRIVVSRALERQALERENRLLRQQLRNRYQMDGIVGTSPAMQEVYDAIQRVADSPVTVIIRGESGTGKGLVASAIHLKSAHRSGPFVAAHCAAIPETLLEAELFGHEKGAFTGATAARIGRFEAASGGTLFLDEIGCISPTVQMKLLRVLEERQVERLGSNRTRPVDFRLIVATNEDLEQKVREGQFREDLFFRVNVFPIDLPALRERPQDVPLLAEHFLRRFCAERNIAVKSLAPAARKSLITRDWPGNVRQLRNLIETVAVLADGETIDEQDVSRAYPQRRVPNGTLPAAAQTSDFKAAVEEFERGLLLEAIRRSEGIKARAARELGLDSSQMKYLSRKYRL